MYVKDLPSFKDMPPVAGMPHGTAWGLFDKNGERDDCGTLNLLTPDNTLEASKEIKSGKSVAMKYVFFSFFPIPIHPVTHSSIR